MTKTFVSWMSKHIPWNGWYCKHFTGKAHNWENPMLNCESGWATSCWPHLDLQFFVTFSVELDLHRHEKLKFKIAFTLQQRTLSEKCSSNIIPGLSKCKQYTVFTFRLVCCLAYSMIDVGPGETLIFAILPRATVSCSSLCMIILYGESQFSSSSRINKSQATCMALC